MKNLTCRDYFWPAVYLCGLFVASSVALANPLSVISVRVNASSDDAEEANDAKMKLSENSLDFGDKKWVGMRFRNLAIPAGSTIVSASLTVQAKGNSTATPAAATLFAEASDDAATFTTTDGSISTRSRTVASYSIAAIPAIYDNQVLPVSDISSLIQEVIDRPGWVSGNDLALHIRADAAGNRSVDSFDESSLTAPLLYLQYTPNPRPAAPDLLFVVANPAALTAQEAIRFQWLQWWAYRVTLIDDSATQASFDAAIALNDVAYLSQEVLSTQVGTKLKNASIGVVVEEDQLYDDFALSTSLATPAANSFQVVTNNHYITSPFAVGGLVLFSSSQPGMEVTIAKPHEGITLGEFSGGGAGLLTVESGGILSDGTKAAGRRVGLPWGTGGLDFNALNSDGLNVLKRSIEWAAGLTAHWKLNETIGSVLTDTTTNLCHGTYYNLTFPSSSLAVAKIDGGINFDAINDYSEIPNKSCLQLTKALSISAWIRGDAWSTGSSSDTILRKGTTNPNGYQLAVCDGRLTLQLEQNDDVGPRGNTLLQTGRWYHVAGSWDGSNIRLYVSGNLDGTPIAKTAPLVTDTRILHLGGRNAADQFDGVIDDVRLYNYALTGDEVKNLSRIDQPRGVKVVKWLEVQ